MADEKTTLKLFVEKETGKLIFAEATKEFVAFLFYILTLPVAAVFHDNESFSIFNLYQSVANLDSALINSNAQTYLLRPNARNFELDLPRLMQNVSLPCKVDYCQRHGGTSNCYLKAISSPFPMCTSCRSLIFPRSGQDSIVLDATVYMVRDDLTVTPMKADSLISIMSEFNINNVKAMETKTVNVTPAECTKLVKSLSSKTVLTDVFLADYSLE